MIANVMECWNCAAVYRDETLEGEESRCPNCGTTTPARFAREEDLSLEEEAY